MGMVVMSDSGMETLLNGYDAPCNQMHLAKIIGTIVKEIFGKPVFQFKDLDGKFFYSNPHLTVENPFLIDARNQYGFKVCTIVYPWHVSACLAELKAPFQYTTPLYAKETFEEAFQHCRNDIETKIIGTLHSSPSLL